MQSYLDESAAFEVLKKRMHSNQPFSFVRLGDGEALILRYPDDGNREDVDFILNFWFGDRKSEITHEDLLLIRALLINAIKNCDMLGVPSSAQKRDAKKGKNWAYIEKFLEKNIDLSGKIITSHELHLWIQNQERYQELFEGQKCSVISCRSVAAGMKDHFGAQRVNQIFVPEEVIYAHDRSAVKAHYPGEFINIIEKIQSDKISNQYYVGAGVLGKIYVDSVKRSGGRAADLGSAFDSWVNWSRRGSVKVNKAGFSSRSDNKLKVLEGREGWLFLDNDTNNVIQQIKGEYKLPLNFESQWKNLMYARKVKFTARNINYRFLIAPNKECVFSDYLPPGVVLSASRPIGLVQSASAEFVRTIYPIDVLSECKDRFLSYSKGDTHWNDWGSFRAFQELFSDVPEMQLEEDQIEFFENDASGDLSDKLGRKNFAISARLKNPKAKEIFNNGVKNKGNYIVFENEDKNLPRCVLFRDSFSTPMLKYMAEIFSRLVVVWQPNIDFVLVDAEKPQYVVSQQAERFLIGCPEDDGGKSFEDYARDKASP
ncbi:hypothetical protein M2360_000819 [Rhizobium sp. SG_E_25_P2]|uniref:GT-D fold domain-containing protein n=1 Tax=Rhizobium sp. SG_E_25_P2 TaxID=2879942 RepID=UPI00247638A2|nr:hypothetical protein [Rhizobium sp. SG_E_25_P2]MDH6265429.1 hypothetical protein [Rhizobium sp. SG_E_25_P2]